MKAGFVLVAAAAVAAAVLTTAASGRVHAGSQSFDDPVGDAENGTPDVSRIDVSNDDQGNVQVVVSLSNHSSDFQPNEGLLIVMDSDNNPSTGNGGFDYIYAGVKDHTGFFHWNGSGFGAVTTSTLQSITQPGQIGFRINRSELGNVSVLNFFAETTRDNGATFGDQAPATGVFTYKLSLPAPTPAPTPTPTGGGGASAAFLVSAVGAPHAGKKFTVRARIAIGAKSAPPSAEGCAAKIGGAPAKTIVVTGPPPYRSCVIAVPANAAGKTLSVTLLLQYGSSGTTRKLSYVVRA